MSDHHEYNDGFVAGLQCMWGEGYLSPGGREEVAQILNGLDLTGCTVLDIGCGLGAIDILLIEEHKADRIVCIDVEPALIEQAKLNAARSAVADQLDIQLVSPGPLPYKDGHFDVVFSKDAIIHIPDKQACYQEILRVLKPGGHMAISDWFGSRDQLTAEMKEWLEVVNLTFSLGTIENAADTLDSVGFHNIQMRDRNLWYSEYMAQELGSITGENYPRLVELLGEQLAHHRVQSSTLKKTVVEQGQLRPGHLQATKKK